jgi:hypothetical protein
MQCFPLAPLLILIAHSIESLQDKYKMIHIFRRKLPSKYVGMGYWNNIVLLLCYISIVTVKDIIYRIFFYLPSAHIKLLVSSPSFMNLAKISYSATPRSWILFRMSLHQSLIQSSTQPRWYSTNYQCKNSFSLLLIVSVIPIRW